jgi:phosphoribosylamine--glycine ligase
VRILVIGSGGREHALVRALCQPARGRDDVHAAPGNPGIEALAETHPDTPPTPDGILALARKLAPDLVVIGPEAPLVAGAADALREARIPCFGPDAAAARIEGSKSFAKQVMAEAAIPTAASFTCTSRGIAVRGHRRDDRGAPAARPGLQAGPRRRPGAEHRRHGRLRPASLGAR